MRQALLILAAVVLLAASVASASGEARGPCGDQVEQPGGPPQEYLDLVCEGETQLRQGNLEAARDAVFRALGIRLFEVPNYEPIVTLAEIECRRGATDEGIALLRDFECMLDIEIGERQCYRPGSGRRRLGPTPGDVSLLCFRTMCGEIYLSYYDNPTDATRRWVADMRQELVRVRAICSN